MANRNGAAPEPVIGIGTQGPYVEVPVSWPLAKWSLIKHKWFRQKLIRKLAQMKANWLLYLETLKRECDAVEVKCLLNKILSENCGIREDATKAAPTCAALKSAIEKDQGKESWVRQNGRSSILLTCMVTPDWFFENKAREAILERYEWIYKKCGNDIDMRRLVILSKAKIKKLTNILSHNNSVIEDFQRKNTFPCYWVSEDNLLFKAFRNEEILVEDLAIFDGACVVQYDFNKDVLYTGVKDHVVKAAMRLFDENKLNTLINSNIVFKSFEKFWGSKK